MTGRPKAVLFDVDGTLVDSTYLHVAAWTEAFTQVGASVDASHIHRDIGMDSSRLLEDLLGDRADELGDAAKDAHSEAYAKYDTLLRPFDGARELLRDLAAAGIKVVLATSAPPDELSTLRKVLDVDDVVHAETNADDVEQAKPAPDIVQVALDRAGVSADEAVFVGDAVWDIKAAHTTGVSCLAVLTGGISRAELEEAGADKVFASVADLRGALLPG